MRKVRKSWALKVGKESNLVVELKVEASVPRSSDLSCHVQGQVSVPSPPHSDDERYYVARMLVEHTVLPKLRPNLKLRILNMAIRRIASGRTVEMGEKGLSMPEYMWWEKEYIENPYLHALSMKNLNQRLFDIIVNSTEIAQGGKVGVHAASNGVEWMKYLQHVTTEATTRELPYPLFLDKRYIPNWNKDAFALSVKGGYSSRAYKALAKWGKEKGSKFYVVKYGERRFMDRFLKNGDILVNPSRSFDDESYNQALRDDENSMSIFGVRTSDSSVIPTHDLPNLWGDRYLTRDFTSSMDRDYMLYCMGRTLSPTLFAHFGEGYDACVLIHDMDEFVKRVDEHTKAHFPPQDFVHAHGSVTYIDPLGAIQPVSDIPEGTAVTIPFLKHFRHAYQDEFRFVWMPKEPTRNFEKVCVSIGSLEDIAEVIQI